MTDHEQDCREVCNMLGVKFLDCNELVGFSYESASCKWWIPNPVMSKLKELMFQVRVAENILRNTSNCEPELQENK